MTKETKKTKLPALSDKDWFPLNEIADRWNTDFDTLMLWKEKGLLEISFNNKRPIMHTVPAGFVKEPVAMCRSGAYESDLEISLTERDRFEAKYEVPLKLSIGERERRTLLNIIGALLELIKSPRPGRETDTAVIAELIENYDDKYGISERTLKEKFAEAKRTLSEGG